MDHIVAFLEHKIKNKITIANKEWLEAVNVNYELTRSDIDYLLSIKMRSNTNEDLEERNDILTYFDNFDFSDLHTRQACMQPKYEGDVNKAACLSCLQVIIRDNSISLHVFVRSQNFDKNFMFDNQTYALIVNMLSKKLNVSIFKIFVNIISLHKEI